MNDDGAIVTTLPVVAPNPNSRSAIFGSIGEAFGVRSEGGGATYFGFVVVVVLAAAVGWFLYRRK